jgi:hypothetical protein
MAVSLDRCMLTGISYSGVALAGEQDPERARRALKS